MSRTRKKPGYLLHRPSGQAYCRIDGKVHYLGVFNSPKSLADYMALTARWAAEQSGDTSHLLTVGELVLLYIEHARQHYRKGGTETSEVNCIRQATRPLNRLFCEKLACEFGPKALRRVRDKMIEAGLARNSINIHVGRLKRMFRWAVSEELIPPATYQALATLAGLQAGRSAARETEPVKPVSQAMIDAVQPFVSRQVWAMIQVQLASGMRPGEVIRMRGIDLNMSGGTWEYQSANRVVNGRAGEFLNYAASL